MSLISDNVWREFFNATTPPSSSTTIQSGKPNAKPQRFINSSDEVQQVLGLGSKDGDDAVEFVSYYQFSLLVFHPYFCFLLTVLPSFSVSFCFLGCCASCSVCCFVTSFLHVL